MSVMKEFTKGLWKENPVLVLLLGMCPTLAVTSSATNGLGMGLATLCVLLCSNLVISLIRKIVPKKIRIPVYIVVIATFVTIVDLEMQAYAPRSLYDALGIFIPLIVVNCIVLGRAEAFASKNGIVKSILDGLGMGLGFTLALVVLAVNTVRGAVVAKMNEEPRSFPARERVFAVNVTEVVAQTLSPELVIYG